MKIKRRTTGILCKRILLCEDELLVMYHRTGINVFTMCCIYQEIRTTFHVPLSEWERNCVPQHTPSKSSEKGWKKNVVVEIEYCMFFLRVFVCFVFGMSFSPLPRHEITRARARGHSRSVDENINESSIPTSQTESQREAIKKITQ